MATIGVGRLREHIVDYSKLVQAGETMTITSRGREVARLVPPENKLQSGPNEHPSAGLKNVVGIYEI